MLNSEICGKILACRAHRSTATLLPAVSFHEKGGVLGGSRICRILPPDDSGSAVKNRDLSTRPRFWTSATCGFVVKNQGALGEFRFPRTSEIRDEALCPKAKTRQHPVVADASKGRCRKTEQRPFFVIASRRAHDDCFTEDFLS